MNTFDFIFLLVFLSLDTFFSSCFYFLFQVPQMQVERCFEENFLAFVKKKEGKMADIFLWNSFPKHVNNTYSIPNKKMALHLIFLSFTTLLCNKAL